MLSKAKQTKLLKLKQLVNETNLFKESFLDCEKTDSLIQVKSYISKVKKEMLPLKYRSALNYINYYAFINYYGCDIKNDYYDEIHDSEDLKETFTYLIKVNKQLEKIKSYTIEQDYFNNAKNVICTCLLKQYAIEVDNILMKKLF